MNQMLPGYEDTSATAQLLALMSTLIVKVCILVNSIAHYPEVLLMIVNISCHFVSGLKRMNIPLKFSQLAL